MLLLTKATKIKKAIHIKPLNSELWLDSSNVTSV